MKQLIEQQREEYVRIASYTNEYGYLHKIPKYEDVWNWHKQSLKQFIDGLVEETQNQTRKEIMNYLKEIKENITNQPPL